MLPALLLIAALFAYGWYLKGGPFPPRVLAGRRFARLAARSATLFGAGALLLLTVGGRLGAVMRVPPAFDALHAQVRDWLPGVGEPLSLWLMALGMAIGGALGAALSRWRRRVFAFGDISAVLPRSRGELGWAVLLAIDSGVSEELFFRLLLPLLMAEVSGSAVTGFVGATALFGFAHRYQGWQGVVATTLVGVLMAALYLASGRLWVAMLLHMAINLNGLVVRPLAMGVWRSAHRSP